MMQEYPKIETLFERDTTGTKKLIPGKWRNETVEYLAPVEWEFTEKIDGTNIRIHWDGHKVTFGGRTERAQIPSKLVEFLNNTFGGETNAQLFEQKFGENEVILYGEGYGPGIQAVGGMYRQDVSFILFDVFIGGFWLRRVDVFDIAKTFGIDMVPVIGHGTLAEAVELVKTKPMSTIGNAPMEGIVARPLVEVKDRMGRRVIVKVKARDFE